MLNEIFRGAAPVGPAVLFEERHAFVETSYPVSCAPDWVPELAYEHWRRWTK